MNIQYIKNELYVSGSPYNVDHGLQYNLSSGNMCTRKIISV